MPVRFWIVLALSLVAGVAVLFAKGTVRPGRSSSSWRGQIKPPPPPPVPQGPKGHE